MTQIIYKDRAFFFSTHFNAASLERKFRDHGCPPEAATGLAARVAAVARQGHTEPRAVLFVYRNSAGKEECQRAHVCICEMTVRV